MRNWLFLAFVLTVAAQTPDFAVLSKKAAQARDAEKIDDAIRLYRECVRLKPAWPEGLWYLGTLLFDKADYPGARTTLSRFVKAEPKAPPGFAMLGLAEFELKDYKASLAHLQQSLAMGLEGDPRIVRSTRYHAGLLLIRSGNFEVAQQRLGEIAMQQEPDAALILAVGLAALRMPLFPADVPAARRELVEQTGMAASLAAARKPLEARKSFEELIARHPDEPELHNAFGAFLLPNDADAALKEWKRTIELAPKHVPARLQLAFEYLNRGDAASGLPYAREAVELAPGLFVGHNALGRLMAETGDLAGGVKELERARDLAPDSAETRVALATLYARAGRPEEARREREAFQKLRAATPLQ